MPDPSSPIGSSANCMLDYHGLCEAGLACDCKCHTPDASIVAKGACPACRGSQLHALPTPDGLMDYPCPCCVPWVNGFPGEYVRRVMGDTGEPRDPAHHYIIEPSEPGLVAVWNGWPESTSPSVEGEVVSDYYALSGYQAVEMKLAIGRSHLAGVHVVHRHALGKACNDGCERISVGGDRTTATVPDRF